MTKTFKFSEYHINPESRLSANKVYDLREGMVTNHRDTVHFTLCAFRHVHNVTLVAGQRTAIKRSRTHVVACEIDIFEKFQAEFVKLIGY